MPDKLLPWSIINPVARRRASVHTPTLSSFRIPVSSLHSRNPTARDLHFISFHVITDLSLEGPIVFVATTLIRRGGPAQYAVGSTSRHCRSPMPYKSRSNFALPFAFSCPPCAASSRYSPQQIATNSSTDHLSLERLIFPDRKSVLMPRVVVGGSERCVLLLDPVMYDGMPCLLSHTTHQFRMQEFRKFHSSGAGVLNHSACSST